MSSLATIYVGRLVKAGWMFSILIFLVVLLYVYNKLPSFVSLTSQISDFKFFNFQKSNFFYTVLAVFVISNLSWYLISKILTRFNKRNLLSSNKFLSSDKLVLYINWLNGLSLLVNILIILSIIFVGISVSEHQYGLSQISYLILVFLGLGLLWVLLLGYLIFKQEKEKID